MSAVTIRYRSYQVRPWPEGWFEVREIRSVAARSTYVVVPKGGETATCTCIAGRGGVGLASCAHVEAVVEAVKLMAATEGEPSLTYDSFKRSRRSSY